MHEIFHIIGICSDTASHIDLIDIFIVNGTDINIIDHIKYLIKNLFK